MKRKISEIQEFEIVFQNLTALHRLFSERIIDRDINLRQLLIQKIILHSNTLKSLLNPIDITNKHKNGYKISVNDPFSASSTLRSQIEAYATYRHLFINPRDKDDYELRILCWKYAGINQRQSIKTKLLKHKKRKKEEKKELENYSIQIRNNRLFKDLDVKKQKDVFKRLKNRKWEFTLKNGKIIEQSNNFVFKNSGLRKSSIKDIYSFLSWRVHPSYLGIIQLKDMYKGNVAKSEMKTLLRFSRLVNSSLIFDVLVNNKKIIKEYNKITNTWHFIEYRDNEAMKYKHIFKRQMGVIKNYA
jgi:hypothetical protein